MQPVGSARLVGHLLHHAVHTEIVAHVQGMDVRVAWFRLEGVAADEIVGRRHKSAVQLEQTESVQFSGVVAAIAVAQRSWHHTEGNLHLASVFFSQVIFIKFLQYLRSVRPLLDDGAYANMEKLAKEFESTVGGRFQMYLMLKSWWSTNYVSDWWEEYVYLRGRSALMINSNFYGIDAIYMNQTSVQAARAANISYLLLTFRRMVERQELEPVSGFVEHRFFQYLTLLFVA